MKVVWIGALLLLLCVYIKPLLSINTTGGKSSKVSRQYYSDKRLKEIMLEARSHQRVMQTGGRRGGGRFRTGNAAAAAARGAAADRKQSMCARWSQPCDFWASADTSPWLTCCSDDSIVCKCNLWAQNCKCVSRLWGR